MHPDREPVGGNSVKQCETDIADGISHRTLVAADVSRPILPRAKVRLLTSWHACVGV